MSYHDVQRYPRTPEHGNAFHLQRTLDTGSEPVRPKTADSNRAPSRPRTADSNRAPSRPKTADGGFPLNFQTPTEPGNALNRPKTADVARALSLPWQPEYSTGLNSPKAGEYDNARNRPRTADVAKALSLPWPPEYGTGPNRPKTGEYVNAPKPFFHAELGNGLNRPMTPEYGVASHTARTPELGNGLNRPMTPEYGVASHTARTPELGNALSRPMAPEYGIPCHTARTPELGNALSRPMTPEYSIVPHTTRAPEHGSALNRPTTPEYSIVPHTTRTPQNAPVLSRPLTPEYFNALSRPLTPEYSSALHRPKAPDYGTALNVPRMAENGNALNCPKPSEHGNVSNPVRIPNYGNAQPSPTQTGEVAVRGPPSRIAAEYSPYRPPGGPRYQLPHASKSMYSPSGYTPGPALAGQPIKPPPLMPKVPVPEEDYSSKGGICARARGRGMMMKLLVGIATIVLLAAIITISVVLTRGRDSHKAKVRDEAMLLKGSPPPAIKTNNAGRLVTENTGEEVHLRGINYFGFENQMTMLDGLWAPPDVGYKPQLVADMATVVYQLSLLGFNAVRLPFLFGDIFNITTVRPFALECKNASMAAIRTRTLDLEEEELLTFNQSLPRPKYWPPNKHPDKCNEYLPDDTVLNRFLWTMEYFVASGFYVLLDYHPHYRFMSKDVLERELPMMTNTQSFANHWVELWGRVVKRPHWSTHLKGRVLLDLMNEPDGHNMTWHPQPGKSGLTEMFIAAMDKMELMAPGSTLYFVNGGGQVLYDGEPRGQWGLAFGNAFITDPGILESHIPPLSDPNPFFQSLLLRSYRNRVVISPHLYSQSVTQRIMYNTTAAARMREWRRYTVSWGYLNKEGYCYEGDCQIFPIVVGEMGARFAGANGSPRNSSLDYVYFRNVVEYLQVKGEANDGKHAPVTSWFWWCYNANSFDTGGIVTDSWLVFDWFKLTFLRTHLGLKPWWNVHV